MLSDGLGPQLAPTIGDLQAALQTGSTTPHELADRLAAELDRRGDDGIWITRVDRDELHARAAQLEADPTATELPLYGIPFGVKDSIDVAGLPTTLACPAYAYPADRTAPAIGRLLAAGAVLAGKTNLDQFATGLNGTRTPYGIPENVYGNGLAPGGSSSGSALAVATGQVPFAVATDTAGSGRVPAALNGILGFKPSRGLISTVGLVPACRSLDCLSLMAGSVADLRTVFGIMAAVDPADPWSRPRQHRSLDAPRIGLPPVEELDFFGDEPMRRAHETASAVLPEIGPVSTVPIDPFLQAGELLYSGPWVAERLLEFADILATARDQIHPVVAAIISGGAAYTAVDTFRAQYRLAELKADLARLWETVDVVVLPTIPTTFTVEQILADPIGTNTALGTYTHCGNLLDLCAIAVPAGLTDDGRPCSLMVLGAAGSDDVVLDVAGRLTADRPPSGGPTPLPDLLTTRTTPSRS